MMSILVATDLKIVEMQTFQNASKTRGGCKEMLWQVSQGSGTSVEC